MKVGKVEARLMYIVLAASAYKLQREDAFTVTIVTAVGMVASVRKQLLQVCVCKGSMAIAFLR